MSKRQEPQYDATIQQYGQQFATNSLLKELCSVSEGSTVEIDWKTSNGLEVSKVGTVQSVTGGIKDIQCVDLEIHTGGLTDTCYLHINPQTRDVFFSDDSRIVGERKLIHFNSY